jgi:hypothetical protein
MQLSNEQKEQIIGAVEALVSLRNEASHEFRMQYEQPDMDLRRYNQLIDKYFARRDEFNGLVATLNFPQS